jgi:putative hemolysin
MATELLIVLLLVLANGLFAGAEIALISVRGSRVHERASRGDRRAHAVAALREIPERFLATVQIGITLVGSAAAAFGGARIATQLAPVLEDLGFGAQADAAAIGIVIVLISFLSLVLGELVPKSLALRYSESYAFFIGRPLLALSRIARPIVWLLTACSNLVLRAFGDRTSFTESRVTRDELQHLVQEAARSGSVDAGTGEIATRALTFGEVSVSEVMVSRERVVAIRKDATHEELQRLLLEEGHSRMPVFDRDPDRMVGYVVARDLLAVLWQGGLVVMDDIIRPVYEVPASARIDVVLRELQARRIQLAVVHDEHGSAIGMVTIEDLIEELIGEVFDEGDVPDELIRHETPDTAVVAGWVPIRKVNRALHVTLPIARESTTIAGLCLSLALSVPAPGTRLTAPDGTILEVVDASARRVRMVRVIQPRRELTVAAT